MPLAMHVCAHSYLIKPPWASNGHKLFLFSINFLLSVVPKINNSECSVQSHIVPLVKLVAPRSLLLCTYVTIYITALSPSLPPLENFTLILMSSHDLMFPLFPPALSQHLVGSLPWPWVLGAEERAAGWWWGRWWQLRGGRKKVSVYSCNWSRPWGN